MFEEDEDFALSARDRKRLAPRAKKRRAKSKPKKTEPPPSDGPTVGGVVIGVHPSSVTVVLADDTSVLAALSGRIGDEGLCVGDDVTVRLDAHGEALVVRVGPRRTLLVRTNPHLRHRDLAIVANVDVIGIVGAASDPPLRPRLIDRYLVAIERSGAEPVIVVNKLDEAGPDRRAELDEQLAPYRDLGLVVHYVSAATGAGLDALSETLQGRRAAFVGHSGVGKSSLVAALGVSDAAAAGDLADHGRGRHTTSTSSLHRLPGGTELIDTPGVRQFGLFALTRRQLRAAFPEFEPFAERCPYASCAHYEEPDCAVREAAEAGDLPWARYDSYRRLLPQAD